jgi:hypothetical protein
MAYKNESDRRYAQYLSGYVWASSNNHKKSYPYGFGSGDLEQEIPIAIAVFDFHHGKTLRGKQGVLEEIQKLMQSAVVPQLVEGQVSEA